MIPRLSRYVKDLTSLLWKHSTINSCYRNYTCLVATLQDTEKDPKSSNEESYSEQTQFVESIIFRKWFDLI